MTKSEFKEKYFEEIGSDLCGPAVAFRICSNEMIVNSVSDQDTKQLLSRLSDEMCKTLQVLENAIYDLCD